MSDKNMNLVGDHEHTCFNYTHFLAASCKKRWRFWDAIYGVMPVFGMVTRNSGSRQQSPAEYLKGLALQIISTQVSDEINIARLIKLAEQQRIARFDILLPYALSDRQIDAIRCEYHKPVHLFQHDECLSIRLPDRSD